MCTFGGTDAKPKCKWLIDSSLRIRFGGDGRTLSDCRDRAELERIPQTHRVGHKSIGQ